MVYLFMSCSLFYVDHLKKIRFINKELSAVIIIGYLGFVQTQSSYFIVLLILLIGAIIIIG